MGEKRRGTYSESPRSPSAEGGHGTVGESDDRSLMSRKTEGPVRGGARLGSQTHSSVWKLGKLWEEIHTVFWRGGRKRELVRKIIRRSYLNLTFYAIKTLQ